MGPVKRGPPIEPKIKLGYALKKKENGVTVWSIVEPLTIPFEAQVSPATTKRMPKAKLAASQALLPKSKADIQREVADLIKGEKLGLEAIAERLKISLTTVRRICRTLKLGPYRKDLVGSLKSKSSQTPFGWVSTHGRLTQHPKEWKWVRIIFSLRADGKSLSEVVDYLNQHAVPTKNGGKWHRKTISQIIQFNKP